MTKMSQPYENGEVSQENSPLARINAELKDRFQALLTNEAVLDLAYIGNTSGRYRSNLGSIVDFDVFLFARAIDSTAGKLLGLLREQFCEWANREGADFDLRIIEGPFKPAIVSLKRPLFQAHVGVFTQSLYLASAPLKRWAWRKYRCEREPDRLARWAPAPPTLEEFINGRKGLRERLAAIERGSVQMTDTKGPAG